MKLLIYSHFFAPSVGGVETLVMSLARGLTEMREARGDPLFEVTLVTNTPAGEFEDGRLKFPVLRRLGARELWRLIRSSEVMHVAGPAMAPMLLGLLARKPVVVEHHGFQTICPNGQLLIEPASVPCSGHFMAGRHAVCLRCNRGQGRISSLRLWLLTLVRRFLCRRVASNITPTAWLGTLVQLPRTVAIPHGLESLSQGEKLRTQAKQPPVVVFLGRLVTTKGAGLLLEAARILREKKCEFELLLIGDGPERPALERQSQEPGLAGFVRFAGRLANEELEAALSGASLVVVPSLGGEVFGLVVAENMARGLPVIASDLGAFAEVIADGGLTFRTGDAAGLADEMERVLVNPALAAELSARARRRAQEFCNFQRMLEAHVRVYREAIGRPVREGR